LSTGLKYHSVLIKYRIVASCVQYLLFIGHRGGHLACKKSCCGKS